jgi:hypothetical protein
MKSAMRLLFLSALLLAGSNSLADIFDECRTNYFSGSSGYNDDSYWYQKHTIVSGFSGSITDTVERYLFSRLA